MSIKIRSKKLKDGSESLYLDIYYKGNRSYEFLDLKYGKNDPNKKQIRELAEKVKAKRELDLGYNHYNIPNRLNGKEDFLIFYEKLSEQEKYKPSFVNFKSFVNDKLNKKVLPFNSIDETFCEDYKEWLLCEISHNSAWLYLNKLKTVLNKAVREKKIPINFAKYVKISLLETERVYLTFQELQTLAKTEFKFKDVKEAFLFACYTGLRFSDICNLTWNEVNENKIFFRQQKTKGIEYLPLNKNAIDILNTMKLKGIHENNKIFNIASSTERLGQKIREWAQKAKINKYITFHSARHTFATLSLTYGVDLYTVSKMLGHKSIRMTEVYAKIVNEKLDNAAKMFPTI